MPVVQIKQVETRPGGAANVAANLSNLGCRTILSGAIGNDQNGEALTWLVRQHGVEAELSRIDQPTITKRRSDRNHIVYRLVVNGKDYIGVTVKDTATAAKSPRRRVSKHWYRRNEQGKNGWRLYREIRKLSDRTEILAEVITIIRGKAEAHAYERELIRIEDPALNTDKR